MNLADALSVASSPASAGQWYGPIKRGLDVVISALLLVVLSPLFAVCALVICFDSPGPVLFRQVRVGENGHRFTMLKFRTMFRGTDSSRHRDYVTALIRGEAIGQPTKDGLVYKLVDDDRITRVGRRLRRTSLDELPQLWNVLWGEMSLVGPRPPVPYETEQYHHAHLARLAVKPGITGWWQVKGRCTTSFEEMVALDQEYIRRRSIRMDVLIMIQTLPAVWRGRGAQ